MGHKPKENMGFIWLFCCSLICIHFENSAANTTASDTTTGDSSITDITMVDELLMINTTTLLSTTNGQTTAATATNGETTAETTTIENTTVSTTSEETTAPQAEPTLTTKWNTMTSTVSENGTDYEDEEDKDESGLSGGAIAVIVIGSVIFFCLIVGVVVVGIKLNTAVTPAQPDT